MVHLLFGKNFLSSAIFMLEITRLQENMLQSFLGYSCAYRSPFAYQKFQYHCCVFLPNITSPYDSWNWEWFGIHFLKMLMCDFNAYTLFSYIFLSYHGVNHNGENFQLICSRLLHLLIRAWSYHNGGSWPTLLWQVCFFGICTKA